MRERAFLVWYHVKEIARDQFQMAWCSFIVYYICAYVGYLRQANGPSPYVKGEAIGVFFAAFTRLGHFWPTLIAALVWGFVFGPVYYVWGRFPKLDKYPLPFLLCFLFTFVWGYMLFAACSDGIPLCVLVEGR